MFVCVCVCVFVWFVVSPSLNEHNTLPFSQTRAMCNCGSGGSHSSAVSPSTNIVSVDHVPGSVVNNGVMLGNSDPGAAFEGRTAERELASPSL